MMIDLKNDPQFEDLQALVRQAVSAEGTVNDWEKIVALSTDILDHKAKDLLVAGYRAIGLFYTKKLDGLLDGMESVFQVIESQWKTCSPSIEKPVARVRAIEWWIERSSTAMRSLKGTAYPHERAEALLARCRKVDAFLEKQLDQAPSLINLIQGLEAATQAPEPVPVVLPSAATPTQTPEGAIDSKASADKALERLQKEMGRLGRYYQSTDASDPRAYRLNRQALWLSMNSCPSAENGRTKIPPPQTSFLQRLNTLQSAKTWAGVVDFAEDYLTQQYFWLDLNRACADGLDALGHTAAAEAILHETRAFVNRLDGLVQLGFSDGTPFANEETVAWLALTPEVAAPVSGVDTLSLERSIRQDLEPMKQLLKKRNYTDAARVFADRLRNAWSVREEFLCRLEFATVLSQSGSAGWFAAQADQILKDIDVYRLDRFDPDLASKGIRVALKGYRAQSDVVSKKKTEELLHRLAQVDLAEFVRQGGAN